MNKFKILACLGVLVGMGGFFGLMLYKARQLKQPNPSFIGETQNFFTTKLKEEQTILWGEIKREFGLDLQNLTLNSLPQHENSAQSSEITTKPIMKIVQTVAKEFNFDIAGLEIIIENTKKGTLAYTTELNQLIIEERLFSPLPEKLQKFVIAHELHHIFNNDFQESIELEKIIQNVTLTPEQKNLIAQYDRFQEKQADICAALKGTYWAESFLAFAQEGMKRAVEDPGSTHPTFKERAQLAQTILEYMHNGIQTA